MNANLTGGNFWDGTVFTVGTAGLYQFNVQIVTDGSPPPAGGVASAALPMLDIGDNSYDDNDIFGVHAALTSSVMPDAYRQRGIVTTTVYLTAGTRVSVRASGTTSTTPAVIRANATTLTITKL